MCSPPQSPPPWSARTAERPRRGRTVVDARCDPHRLGACRGDASVGWHGEQFSLGSASAATATGSFEDRCVGGRMGERRHRFPADAQERTDSFGFRAFGAWICAGTQQRRALGGPANTGGGTCRHATVAAPRGRRGPACGARRLRGLPRRSLHLRAVRRECRSTDHRGHPGVRIATAEQPAAIVRALTEGGHLAGVSALADTHLIVSGKVSGHPPQPASIPQI
jgi:hypothetical protein